MLLEMKKIHIYSKFGAILFTIVNFSFLRQTQDGNTKWKMLKFTIMDKIAPNLELVCIFSFQARFKTIILGFEASKEMFWHKN